MANDFLKGIEKVVFDDFFLLRTSGYYYDRGILLMASIRFILKEERDKTQYYLKCPENEYSYHGTRFIHDVCLYEEDKPVGEKDFILAESSDAMEYIVKACRMLQKHGVEVSIYSGKTAMRRKLTFLECEALGNPVSFLMSPEEVKIPVVQDDIYYDGEYKYAFTDTLFSLNYATGDDEIYDIVCPKALERDFSKEEKIPNLRKSYVIKKMRGINHVYLASAFKAFGEVRYRLTRNEDEVLYFADEKDAENLLNTLGLEDEMYIFEEPCPGYINHLAINLN